MKFPYNFADFGHVDGNTVSVDGKTSDSKIWVRLNWITVVPTEDFAGDAIIKIKNIKSPYYIMDTTGF